MIAFLGIMSLFVFIIFGIMSVISLVRKKGTLKRNALITVISFALAIFLMAVDPNNSDTETVEDNDKQGSVEVKEEEVAKEETEKKTDIKDEEEKEEEKKEQKEDAEEDLSWDDVKDKNKIIGKSDKDFKELTKSKPGKVRNDKTDKWRKVTFSENENIEEYLLSYQELYMEEGDTHFIINFNYDTTTVVNYMNELIYADIHEYEKREEHDASTLGSGMLLGSFVIYPDGDIQELEG